MKRLTRLLLAFWPLMGPAQLGIVGSVIASSPVAEAQVAFVDDEQTANGTASVTWTANIPALSAAGELAVFLASSNNTTSFNSSGSATVIGSAISSCGSSDSGAVLMQKELSSGDISAGDITFTDLWNDTEQGAILTVVYSGQSATSPIHIDAQASGFVNVDVDVSGPSITPTIDDTMIVQLISTDPGAAGYSAVPAGTPLGTERFDGQDGSDRQWAYAQEFLQTTAAAVELDANIAQSDNYCRWQISIAEAAGTATLRRRRQLQ